MRIGKYITKFIALSLAVLMLLATPPVSVAETAAANIGSVSAVGSVQLRGVGISEGTLFSGDRINVSSGGYAKVVLSSGTKVEVDGSSDVTFSKNGDTTNIEMKSGNIAFTGGQKPVRVQVGVWEVTAAGSARGTVAYVGSSAFGVRVLEGTVNLRDTATKKTSTLQKGTEQIVSLTNSTQTGSVRLASSSPTAIPPAPSMPRAQSSAGLKTALLIGTVVGAGGAIAVLMTKNKDTDADAAARLRAATALQTASNISTTVVAATTAATQIADASTNASAAINNAPTSATFTQAEKNALIARANTLTSSANASKGQILTLQLQLANLQDQLANASPGTVAALETQIANVLSAVNLEVDKLNGFINQLNSLVNDARAEVPNVVPIPTIQPVEEAEGSASPTTP